MTKRVLLIALVVIVIGTTSYFFFTKYSEGTNLFRVTSTEARIGSSEHALVIFERNPILGVGFDAYRYAQKRYGFIGLSETHPAFQAPLSGGDAVVDHGGAGTDNSWLFVLATTGFVGFVTYMYLWWSILRFGGFNKTLWKGLQIPSGSLGRIKNQELRNNNGTMKQWNNNISPVLLSSSLALFINCFFINSLFYPAIMVWMWMLVGLNE